MRITSLAVLVAGLVSCFAPSAIAWGRSGHYMIGEATYQLLDENTRKLLNEAVQLQTSFNSSMGTASIWADIVKYTPKYAWTRVLHYYDNEASDPPTRCEFHAPEATDKKNMLSAIQNFTDTFIKDKRLNTLMNIHLLQDLHQPLHLAGKARGGNSVDIPLPYPSHRNVSLHGYWDVNAVNMLVNRYHGNTSHIIEDLVSKPVANVVIELNEEGMTRNYVTRIDTTVTKLSFSDHCDSSSLMKWSEESERRNCEFVWRETYDQDYHMAAPDHVYTLLKLASWRSACHLTKMLNQ